MCSCKKGVSVRSKGRSGKIKKGDKIRGLNKKTFEELEKEIKESQKNK